jgi:hypothetical protein
MKWVSTREACERLAAAFVLGAIVSLVVPGSSLGAAVEAPWQNGVTLRACGSFYGEGEHRDHGGSWGDDDLAVDFACRVGAPAAGTPIVAPFSGQVVKSEPNSAYGNTIVVEASPCGRAFRVAHLRDRLVTTGGRVEQGDLLGHLGQSGSGGNGFDHLHFALYSSCHPGAAEPPDPMAGQPMCKLCYFTSRTGQSAAIDVFARGGNNALWHRRWHGGWSAWESLGPDQLTSAPAAVSPAAGVIDVFARGDTGELVHRRFSGAWGTWEKLGGALASAPAATSPQPGVIDVFAVGTDQQVWHRRFHGTWGAWEPLGGQSDSAPAATSPHQGVIDLFVRGGNGHLFHRRFAGYWGAWEDLAGELTSAPAAASEGAGTLDVFARGVEGRLVHRRFAGQWGTWESLGEERLAGAPAATAPAAGVLDVFARGEVNQLIHRRFDARWGAWENLDGSLTSDPAVTTTR